METADQKPFVGIGVMVWKDGKLLVGKRKSKLGQGEYAWPGGKLEYMESIEECCRREVREEAGIEVKNIRFLRLMNLTHYPPKHFLDIAMMCDWESGEPKVMEPDKCEGWGWYDPEHLPEPLFHACKVSMDALKTGKLFYDT